MSSLYLPKKNMSSGHKTLVTFYLTLFYWLVNGDPYNGLLKDIKKPMVTISLGRIFIPYMSQPIRE